MSADQKKRDWVEFAGVGVRWHGSYGVVLACKSGNLQECARGTMSVRGVVSWLEL